MTINVFDIHNSEKSGGRQSKTDTKKIFTISSDKRTEPIKYYTQGADLQSTVNRSLNKSEIAQTRRTFGRVPFLL